MTDAKRPEPPALETPRAPKTDQTTTRVRRIPCARSTCDSAHGIDFEFSEDADASQSLDNVPISAAVSPAAPIFDVADVEANLVSCIFVDADDVFARCETAGVSAAMFQNEALAAVFEVALRLWNEGKRPEPALLVRSLQSDERLAAINIPLWLARLSDIQATTAQAGAWIDAFCETAQRRAVHRALTNGVAQLTGGANLDSVLSRVRARIEEAELGTTGAEVRTFADFSYPAGDDPSVLLGSDDYLGRGGGMLFVSHAGAGKSSFILDACMSWALARPWVGIRSNGPLKSLIVQAEDSDRYIGKVLASFSHANGLSADERAQLASNLILARVKGKCGQAFLTELRRLVRKQKPDLVVINPVYLYAEGDIGRSEFAQPFLLGLDDVNRDQRFGYILVHHTGKPSAKDPRGKRTEVEDWESAYMGFGSSFWANWPRCTALLEPRSGMKSRYWLKLGKGGLNAGVVKEVEHQASKRFEPVTKVAVRHSAQRMPVGGKDRPVICWELDTDDGADPEAQPKKEGVGRPAKYTLEMVSKALPRGEENRQNFPRLLQAAVAVAGIPRSSFRDLLFRHVEAGDIRQHEDGRFYV